MEFRPQTGMGGDCIKYLQDAHELPYWKFMLSAFMVWRNGDGNSTSIVATSVLHVLSNVVTRCRRWMAKLEAHSADTEDEGAIKTLLGQIEKRLTLLDDVVLGHTSDPDDLASGTSPATNTSVRHSAQHGQSPGPARTDSQEVCIPV